MIIPLAPSLNKHKLTFALASSPAFDISSISERQRVDVISVATTRIRGGREGSVGGAKESCRARRMAPRPPVEEEGKSVDQEGRWEARMKSTNLHTQHRVVEFDPLTLGVAKPS